MKKRIVIAFLSIVIAFGAAACDAAEQTDPSQNQLKETEEQQTEQGVQQGTQQPGSVSDADQVQEGSGDAADDGEAGLTAGNEVTEQASEEEKMLLSSITVNNSEDAVKLLQALFGTEDAETGYAYLFGYIGDFTIDGTDYYGFQWSWLVDGDHLSRLTDLLVKTDGSAVYQGSFEGGEDWEIISDNMLE